MSGQTPSTEAAPPPSDSLRLPLLHIAACAAPTLIFLLVLWAIFRGETAVWIFFAEIRHSHRTLTRCVELFTDYGNVLINLPYVVLLTKAMTRKRRDYLRFVLAYAIALATTLLAAQVVKGAVGRARPYLAREFAPWSWGPMHDSFPSGHTTEAMAAAIPLSQFFRSLAVPAMLGLYVAAMGLSRIYCGVHFMTDVLAGLVMGCGCGLLARLILVRRWMASPETLATASD